MFGIFRGVLRGLSIVVERVFVGGWVVLVLWDLL